MTIDTRALQRLPLLDGEEETDGYEALFCSARSCGLVGPTC